MTAKPSINADRLWQNLMALAAITEEHKAWTRRSFTPKFLEGRAWLQGAFAKAGLEIEIDAGGNLIGRREGSSGNLAPLMMGSHSDTVPSGGRFDGVLGVLCALEVAQTLHEARLITRHPLEVVDFLAEEPSEFGLSCVGSRALAGALTPEMLEMTRPDGMTLAEGLAYVGGDPESLSRVARGKDAIAAYLEVHIEQARALEAAKVPVGVVTGIAAIRRQRIRLAGQTDHAGATPMDLRRDALVAAGEFIAAVSEAANKVTTPENPLVATVGWMDVRPNAANAVPGEVEMILEARAALADKLDRFLDVTVAGLLEKFPAEGIKVTRENLSTAAAAPCDKRIVDAIEAVAQDRGLPSMRMPSGAGHDGVFISQIGPIGMIFLPCRDGRSHTPEEWAEPAECAIAAQVMLDAIIELDKA